MGRLCSLVGGLGFCSVSARLFSLARMFFVFAVWAFFGLSYPSDQIPFALNVTSKILSFVTAITLILKADKSD